MSGRYILSKETVDIVLKKQLQNNELEKIQTGEIFPGTDCLVQTASGLEIMHWGYDEEWLDHDIINTRSETLLEEFAGAKRRTFLKDYTERKCVVIASGFYEWKDLGDRMKERYLFSEDKKLVNPLYLAAIYHDGKTRKEFSIITQEATKATEEINDRLPVIIPADQVQTYLQSTDDSSWLARQNLDFIVDLVDTEPTGR